jgi:ABC-2 type transport system permease protein
MSAAPSLRLRPRPKYLAIALSAVQQTLAYRRTVLISLATSLIWVVAAYYLWQAVFAAQPEIGSFDWDRMRTYILLSYAVNVLLYSSFATYRIMFIIRTGDIANELIRPFDFMLAQLAQSVGGALVEGLFSSLVAGGLGLIVFQGQLPASPGVAVAFVVSVLLGFIVKFLINFLVALLCFWTKSVLGLVWAQTAIVNILSGAVIPLEFFPDWLRTLTLYLPFQAVVHTPLAIYLGDVQGPAILVTLGVQAFWVLALLGLARLLWMPSLRALEIQGG